MGSIQEDMIEFRGQLEKGSIQRAYRALLSTMMGLRTYFRNGDTGFAVSGLYQGTLDMTYFALFPPSLKERGLKIAIVFNYDAFRFEAWLAGSNRRVQLEYWELFRDGRWPQYRVVAPAAGIDSIIECDLAEDFDLGNPDDLTTKIERTTVAFIDDIERFLAREAPGRGAEQRG